MGINMQTLLVLTAVLVLGSLTHSSPLHMHRSRSRRSVTDDPDLSVDVDLKYVNLKPGMSATFRCRAKGGRDINKQPYVSFYRLLGPFTHMPLSTGDPGIQVQPDQPNGEDMESFYGFGDSEVIKSVKILNIGPAIFETLVNGENKFYCKVSTLSGHTATSFFTVNRIAPRYRPRRPPYHRRLRG